MVNKLFPDEVPHPLTDIQDKLARIERALTTAVQEREAHAAFQRQTHDALDRLLLWSRALLAGLVVVAVLTVGIGAAVWWELHHRPIVQLVDPHAGPAPAPRQPAPARK